MSIVSPDHPSNLGDQTLANDAHFWLAAIADSSDDAIVGNDLNGIVISWNKSAEVLFGFKFDEIVGQPINRIIPPDRIHEEASMLALIRRGERAVDFETAWQHKNGRLLPVSLTVSPIRDGQNIIIGISQIVRDLGERDRRDAKLEESETALAAALALSQAGTAGLDQSSSHLVNARDRSEQANRAKSRFLNGMSHELRTPLNSIMGYAHLLQIEGGLNPAQEARVQAMLASGKHVLEMIACVLYLSEIEAEHVTQPSAKANPKAIVAECLDLVRPAADAKGVTLRFAMSSDIPMPANAVLDPRQLRQVVLDLLGNAVKFTERSGVTVGLRTIADGSAMRIEIAETGRRIRTNRQQQRLFQGIERLDMGATSKLEGVGLALSNRLGLPNRLVASMGGRLGHDDNPNGGSVFWLELPLDTVATLLPEAEPVLESQDASAQPTRPLHVLVVDDILMNREIAGSLLQTAGHKVTCVESGAEAISAAASTDFDCILMDVRMPEMDGLEATRRIRLLDGERGRVPIVALTAQAFIDQIAECHKAGMDSHLPKPFDPKTLLNAVVQAVSAELRPSLNLGPGSIPPAVAVGPATPEVGSELPVLDVQAFNRTAAFLTPDKVAAYLETIVTLGQSLLAGFRKPEALTADVDALVEMAHTLAGSAGMFGFERVASLGRRFEHAVETGAADVTALSGGLCAAIAATCEEAHIRTPYHQDAQAAAKCSLDAALHSRSLN